MVGVGRLPAPGGDSTNARIGPAGPFTISSSSSPLARLASHESPDVVSRLGGLPGSMAYTSQPSYSFIDISAATRSPAAARAATQGFRLESTSGSSPSGV